jgi:hypothetical protein
MLRRWFPTDGIRDALARGLGYPSVTALRSEPPIDTSTNEGFVVIEAETDRIESLLRNPSVPTGQDRLILDLLRAFVERAAQGASHVQDKAFFDEPSGTPAQVVHSLICNGVSAAIGDGPYDLSWLSALADTEPDWKTEKHLTELVDIAGGGVRNYALHMIANAPLGSLLCGATVSRHLLATCPVPYLVNRDDLDYVAAKLSPALWGTMQAFGVFSEQVFLSDKNATWRQALWLILHRLFEIQTTAA